MKTKEEVIKEAFDMGWNSYHDCETKSDYSNSLESCLIKLGSDNRGWIKIESEDDLPKEKTVCWVKDRNQSELICGEFLNNSKEEKKYWSANATHYQPIIKPLKPLY